MDIVSSFRNFFYEFTDQKGHEQYLEQIRRMTTEGKHSLLVDYADLLRYDPELAEEAVFQPEEVLSDAETALWDVLRTEEPEFAERIGRVHVRVINSYQRTLVPMRAVRAEHISRLIAIEGIVTRATEIKPLLTQAWFRCLAEACGHEFGRLQEEGRYNPPVSCPNAECNRKGPFKLLTERSTFVDWQRITLQEKPEDLPPGQMPQSFSVVVRDDLVDVVRPGDRAIVTGVLHSHPERMLKRGQLATYSRVLEGVACEKETEQYEKLEISPEDEENIRELSKDPVIVRKIAQSIAPSIHGYEVIKEAIACLLFGGAGKETPDGMRIRGDVNILLVGDPGVGKSQILKNISNIAPRGLYTSGRGSSAAGLTAAVMRDPDSGEMSLEAGALVLADLGLAAIDEFDKMRSEDRSAIHEALEQHSYHPSFEIALSDRFTARIGDFVDRLFVQFPERKIDGIDCEILDTSDLGMGIFTTDFDTIFETDLSRVSRHAAPTHFVKIQYSNGRNILVTPEHPIFAFKDGEVITTDADKVQAGSFAPGPKGLEYQGMYRLDTAINSGRKKINLPAVVNTHLASFLGYFVTEGYSYEGSAAEVGLSNTDPYIIQRMKEAIRGAFSIEPIDNTAKGRAIRIISKSLLDYMRRNFPEVMTRSFNKRIPRVLFLVGLKEKILFLRAAFEGDGGIESEAVAYSTNSKGLAEDYQDLLLSLRIHSRICSYKYTFASNTQSRTQYKVYITGDCLEEFATIVIPEILHSNEKLAWLVERSRRSNRGHNVLPPYVGVLLRKCLKKLGLSYNGYFDRQIKGNHGVTEEVVSKYLENIENRILDLISVSGRQFEDLRGLREAFGYSQDSVAGLIEVTRRSVDYAERGGYDRRRRQLLIRQTSHALKQEIDEAKGIISRIKQLMKFRWLRVRKVEIIQNKGNYQANWVYDVTVEPTKSFIGKGVVLHNTVSIAKAGIVATLNARASVLAAANPRDGRWDPWKDPAYNINLPPTLLSRFDLIFPLTDQPDEVEDERKSEHILRIHQARSLEVEPPLSTDLLKKYISYARQQPAPVLSNDAIARLHEFYLDLRKRGVVTEKDAEPIPVPITPRQLEALIRLAEARARMELRAEVLPEDAVAAIRLLTATMEALAIDLETGVWDSDRATTGISTRTRGRQSRLSGIIDGLAAEHGTFSLKQIIQKAEKDIPSITESEIVDFVEFLKREGKLYEPQTEQYRKASR